MTAIGQWFGVEESCMSRIGSQERLAKAAEDFLLTECRFCSFAQTPQDQSSRSITHLKQRGGRLTNSFVVVALAGEPEAHVRRKPDVRMRGTLPNFCSFLLLDSGD